MIVFANGSEEAKEDFIKFMEDYALFICLGVVGVIIITIIVIFVIKNKSKKGEIEHKQIPEEYDYSLFGGKENIVSFEATGSRVNLVLKDYDLLDKEGLKKIGVNNFIKMADRIILVCENSEKIVALLR